MGSASGAKLLCHRLNNDSGTKNRCRNADMSLSTDGGGKNLVSFSSGSSCFLSMVINVCFPMMMFYIPSGNLT